MQAGLMRTVFLVLSLALSSTAFAVDPGTKFPINQLGAGPYNGVLFGGLYANGSNNMPADHAAAGLQQAALIGPLDQNGNASPAGKVVFLSIGSGEVERIMCSGWGSRPCEPGSFIAMAGADRRVNHKSLVILNAGRERTDYRAWTPIDYGSPIYETVRLDTLMPAGVTEKQVQVVWIQLATNNPTKTMVTPAGDAWVLKQAMATTLKLLRTTYPNLRIAYLSSRVYGGYATTSWNPEPYAYESGFTIRFVLIGQIDEARLENPGSYWDSRLGDIDYRDGSAPWLAWGPYLWADGPTPRPSDGATWAREDFEADGESLSPKGAQKGARQLLNFLLSEPTARTWFLTSSPNTRQRSVRSD